jgi:hypothetical protein
MLSTSKGRAATRELAIAIRARSPQGGRDMIAIYRSEGCVGQALRFTWHFLQMFIAMGIGMAVYGIAVGLLGYQGLGQRQPEIATLLMAFSMVVPMAAWMRFRMGHGWYRTGEMSGAMVVPTVVLVVICSLGLLPHTVALAWSMPVMYVAMLGAMFYRWRDYAQHHNGTAGAERQLEQPGAEARVRASQPSGKLAVR